MKSPWRTRTALRPLGFEPLEARLPLASDAFANDATDVIFWQGREVEVHRGEWIVRMDDERGAAPRQMKRSSLILGAESGVCTPATQFDRQLDSFGHFLIDLGESFPAERARDLLAKTHGVQSIEPNFVVSTEAVPNDPEFARLWGLSNGADHDIDAPEAWDLTTGSSSIVVGVIDTGIDYTHEDLATNIWTNPAECPAGAGTCVANGADDDDNGYIDDFYGWDFINNDNDPFDDHSHGTHVAGTIAAAGNNNAGVVGVNWNAQLMALKFLGADGRGSTAGAIAAIEYATMMKRNHGVNIPLTNNSWGGGGYSQALKDAIAASQTEGMLFVAAAGNDALDNDVSPHYPSSYDLDNVIAVASTTSTDQLSSFSNRGLTSVDLGAPGSSILSTIPNDQYGYKSGTSMAAPHVAGVAALAWAANTNASYTEIRDAIFASADPVPALEGNTVTGGRLNAYGTLQQLGLFATLVAPAENAVIDTAPISFTLDFSDPVNPNSVNPADLTVNGVAANAVNIVDSDTVEFSFDASPVSAEGVQNVTLAGDSILRQSDGDGVASLNRIFYFDQTPLQVTAVTPSDGSVMTLPDPTIRLDFSESQALGSIDTGDLTLSAGRVKAFTVIDSDTVEYHLTGLAFETPLSMTLTSGAVVDTLGFPNQSFAATFSLDFATTAFPGTFVAQPALGSMIYASQTAPGEIHAAADTDAYTLELEAGQMLSTVLVPGASLAGQLRLLDPNGVELTRSTGTAGGTLVVQSQPITETGTYTVVVEGDGNSSGTYDLEVYLGASIEEEHLGGVSNDARNKAQELNPGWSNLDASVSRLGVHGGLSSNTDADWFKVSLVGSQSSSFILHPSDAANVALTLHANNGTQLASGAPVGDAIAIHDFAPDASGSFYVQVAGDASEYTLAVTRGAMFDNNANDARETAQQLGDNGKILGHVGREDATVASAGTVKTTSVVQEFPDEWLEGAVVREEDGIRQIVFREPRDPRALVGTQAVSDDFASIDSDPEGDITRDVVFTADGSRVLVAHRDSENVLVYNAATHAVEADIPVAGEPVSLAITPDGQYALSANTSGDTVTVIDLANLTKIADVPVSSAWPFRVKVTPDSQHAVVATANDAYVVVSLTTFEEVRSIASAGLGATTFSFNTGRAGTIILGYTDFAITPDSTTLIAPASESGQHSIRIYDIATGTETASLATADRAYGVVVNADGSKAFLSTLYGNQSTLTEVNLTTNAIARTLTTEQLYEPKLVFTADEQSLITAGQNKLIFIDVTDGSTQTSVGNSSVGDFAISHDGKYLLSRWVVNLETRSIVASLPAFSFLDLVATSPTAFQGIQATKIGGQSFSVVNIDGANAVVEANLPGGAAPEGDAPTAIALTPDGLTAVTANWESSNASIIDLESKTVLAWIDVGTRPDHVAITPDGRHALLSSPTDDSLTIIDLATRTVVATVPGLVDDPRHIVISNDSGQAFVSTTGAADQQDKVHFIQLDGANSSLTGSVAVGDLANEIAQFTEMTLSPDGTLLAVPITRDGEIVLIDTGTRAVVKRLLVGAFPTEAVFSPDGDWLYVMNENTNSVTVVDVDGANSVVHSTLTGLADPTSMALDQAGRYLYVASYNPAVVEVIDTEASSIVHSISLDSDAPPWKVTLAGNVLYLVGSEGIPVGAPLLDDAGHLLRVLADGPSSRLIDDVLLSGRTRTMAYSEPLRSAVTVAYNNDGIDILSYDAEGNGDEDYYRFVPQVGDQVSISASLPGSGAGLFDNELDIAIELYDPYGVLLQRGDDGSLTHTISSLGEYAIRVYAQGFTEGEYLLTLSGVTAAEGPSLTTVSPADGASDVPLDARLVMSFDESVVAGAGTVGIRRSADDTLFAAIDVTGPLITIDGDTVTVNPGVAWEVDTDYYVLVDEGAFQDGDNNPYAGISDKTLWNFLVGSGHDFGDAPSPYPVTVASDGARHRIADGPRFGVHIDAEFDGMPSSAADADDQTGTTDDEDGVAFSTVRVGQVDATVTVNVQGATAGAKLDAWVDFNRDGTWGGPLEQIADAVAVDNGDNVIRFDVPSWASSGAAYARFRISSAGDLGIVGMADDGEVEDHQVTILPPAASSIYFGGRKLVGAAPNGVESIVPVDLDGDGDVDVIAPRGTGNDLVWHENDGAASFTERIITTQSIAQKVSAGDVDGDGDTDVLSTASGSGLVRWHENLGNGNFADYTIDSSASSPNDVFAVDMDNDGDTDVVVLSISSDTIDWYENDGAQNFTKRTGVSGTNAVSLFVVDVDRDGDHDFVANDSGSIGWYENDGGGFTRRSVTTDHSYRLTAMDIDGDGDIDILSAAYNKITWYENNGSGSFTSHTITSANQAYAVFAADLDGDGDLDVISDPEDNSDALVWHENDGEQNFTTHVITTQSPSNGSPSASDLDGDGDLDVLVPSRGLGQITWYENQDGIPPFVGTMSPADDSAVVAEDTDLVLTFDKDVQTGTGEIVIHRSTDDSVVETIDVASAAVTVAGNRVTIEPGSELAFGVEHYILIGPTVIQDDAGNDFFGIEAPSSWNFTVRQSGSDYGDAPDTSSGNGAGNYDTLASSNGPRHAIVAGLYMGYTVDAEDGSLQNVKATADDANQFAPDDEDGLNDPANDLLLTVGAKPTVSVIVTNTTGSAATLSGWIDFDRDGLFESTESAQVVVPNGTERLPVTLAFPSVPAGSVGVTYARFRLGNDAVAANPTGASAGGEVEDYLVTIVAPGFGATESTTKIAHQLAGGPPLADDDWFGSSVASLGDLDGDGIPDLAIGAPGDDETAFSSGAVYVALMNADGSIKSYERIAGAEGIPLGNANYFGLSMTSVGDLDRDGVNDLAVLSERSGGTSIGSVHFLYLNADGTLKSHEQTRVTIDGNSPWVESLASIGDLDGNGIVDLAVGLPGESLVAIMLRHADGTVRRWQLIGHETGGGPTLNSSDDFGHSVASIGDLDGDGIPDLAVGAIGDDTGVANAGAVYLLYMNADGTAKAHSKIAHQTGGGPTFVSADRFGSSLTPVGDLNADGVTDLLVGAMNDGTGASFAGAAYLLLLDASGTAQSFSKLASNTAGVPELQPFSNYGHAAGAIGDLDGDGRIELAIGAAKDPTGGTGRGAVYVHSLQPAPLINITLASSEIAENGGSLSGTVSRLFTGDLSQPLTVSLTSSDATEGSVPSEVTIPANETSVDFTVTIADDNRLDGTQVVEFSGSANGYYDGRETLNVLDHETLTTTIAVDSISESEATTTATVSRSNSDDLSEALVVDLSSSDTSEATVAETVTIAAGQAISEPFTITIVDDGIEDGPQTVSITASASGYADGGDAFEVLDNESPAPTGVALLAVSDTGVSDSDRITRRDNSSLANTLQFSVTGTVDGATVTIYAGDIAVGNAVAAGTTTTVTTDGDFDLADGTHSITARQIQTGSAESPASGALAVTIDTVAPGAPSVPDLQTSSDSGSSDTDNITNVTAPSFAVATGADAFRFYRDGSLISDAFASGTSFTTPSQADGTYAYSVTAVDVAGNESADLGTLSVIIDTEQPTADVVDVMPDPRGMSVAEVTVAFNEPVVSFALADFSLRVEDSPVSLTGANDPTSTDNASWTIPSLSAATAAGGAYELRILSADVTDVAGNALTADAVDTWFRVGTPTMAAEPTATAGTSNTVSWSSVPGSVEYLVAYDTSASFDSPDGDSGWISDTSHTFTGLTSGETYSYRATARLLGSGVEGEPSAAVSSLQDNAPPSLLTTTPADDGEGVAIDADLVLTFDEDVQIATGAIHIKHSDDGSTVESIDVTSVVVSGATVTVTPAVELQSLTGYYVQIDAGAIEDVVGNPFAGISDNGTWNFTTGDFRPPVISGSIWLDDDFDGVRDAGEAGAVGVTVYLDISRNGMFDDGEPTQLTADDDPATGDVDESGTYRFEDLTEGRYWVRQMLPQGWGQTTPVGASPQFVDAYDNDFTYPFNFQEHPLDDLRISENGRYLVFSTLRSLVASDTNSYRDVYLADRQTGAIELISVSDGGIVGNFGSFEPDVTADGRFVVFRSQATTFVREDTSSAHDIYVRDRQLGTTQLVSVSVDGGSARGNSYDAVITPDGKQVLFFSYGTQLVTGDTNGHFDTFIRNLETGVTERISLSEAGEQAPDASYGGDLSADGRYALFESHANGLIAGDNNDVNDIFWLDRETGELRIASSTPDGTVGNSKSSKRSISDDGQYVVFDSFASNLTPDPHPGAGEQANVFLKNMVTGEIQRISLAETPGYFSGNSRRPEISGDGRWIAFESHASLVDHDTNQRVDIYLYDRLTGLLQLVSGAPDGSSGNGHSNNPVISRDGSTLAFTTTSTNLGVTDEAGTIVVVDLDSSLTSTAPHVVDVAVGVSAEDLDFGRVDAVGTISGRQFVDANANGRFDDGETVLAGVTVYADLNGNGSLDANDPQAVSGDDGTYTLNDIPPGTHTVRAISPADFRSSGGVETSHRLFAASVIPDARSASDFYLRLLELNPTTGVILGQHDVTVEVNRDMGLAVHNERLLLTNGYNGSIDEFTLDGELVKRTPLPSDGSGVRTGIGPVVVRNQAYVITTGDGGWPDIRKFDPDTGTFSDLKLISHPVDGYPGGEANPNFHPAAGVSADGNFITLSTADDRLVEIDPATGRITRSYLHVATNAADTASAGLDGEFFLAYGVSGALVVYDEQNVLLRTYDRTPGFFGLGGGVFYDNSVEATIDEGNAVTDVDHGHVSTLSSLAGTVYDDPNGNGTVDAGEAPREGATVYLDINGNRQLDAGEPSTVTDANGVYTFEDLPPADYVIRVELDEGRTVQATAEDRTRLFIAQDISGATVISELDPRSGDILHQFPAGIPHNRSVGMALDGDQLYIANDSGLWVLDADTGTHLDYTSLPSDTYNGVATIGGLVYLQRSSANSIIVVDPSDMTLVDEFQILDSNGQPHNLSGALGENGDRTKLVVHSSVGGVLLVDPATGAVEATLAARYRRGGAAGAAGEIFQEAGTFAIEVIAEELQPAAERTLRMIPIITFPYAVAADSVPAVEHRVTVTAESNLVGLDFADHLPPSNIRGVLWDDADADGRIDAGEQRLAGRTVFLDQNANDSLDDGEPTTLTQSDDTNTTEVDETGQYAFEDLSAGEYLVAQVLPFGWRQTTPLTPDFDVELALLNGYTAGANDSYPRYDSTISDKGRFVAFSTSKALLPEDTNGQIDIYVLDRETNDTELVSVATDGTLADGESISPSISADGRFVAFQSRAANFAADDGNRHWDIFVRDRQLGTTTLVSAVDPSQASGSSTGDDFSYKPIISGDGSEVVFWSAASDLVTGDTNELFDLFLRDLQAGTTERVNKAPDGAEAVGGNTHFGQLTHDGRYLVYRSWTTNLVSGDTNAASDVFVLDRQTGTTELVSASSSGVQGNANSVNGSISDDGRFVAFSSSATNLTDNPEIDTHQIYFKDRQTGSVTLVSRGLDGSLPDGDARRPSISADGRWIVFHSDATNLVPGDTNGKTDAFLYDTASDELHLLSRADTSGASDGKSEWVRIARDGSTITFQSDASDLVSPAPTEGGLYVVPNPSTVGTSIHHVVTLSPGQSALDTNFGSVYAPSAPSDIRLSNNTIRENADTSAGDLLVGDLSAIDRDGDDAHVFAFVAGEGDIDNARFKIVGGHLYLNQGEAVDYETQPNYSLRVRATDRADLTYEEIVTIKVIDVAEASEIKGRYIFYNSSAFDGNGSAVEAADSAAIATDKSALLPGGTATFANYTSYSRGINGIMIDVADLPGELTAADFSFRVGNDNDPSGWADAPPPSLITVRAGEGIDGFNRIIITWPDGAIAKTWLQVTLKANPNTALESDDIHYWGNAIGETGNDNENAIVNGTDIIGARDNPRSVFNRAAIDDQYDVNRDELVNGTDVIVARDNVTSVFTALRLISPPTSISTISAVPLLSTGNQVGHEREDGTRFDLETLDQVYRGEALTPISDSTEQQNSRVIKDSTMENLLNGRGPSTDSQNKDLISLDDAFADKDWL